MGFLRLFLAISILIAHSTPIFGFSLVGGRVAVESFYLISGFYMSLVLTKKYQGQLKAFYFNLFIKLFPLYWLFLLLSLLLGLATKVGIQAYYDFRISIPSLISLTFLNLTPLFQNITNFLGFNPQTGSLFITSHFRDFKPEIWNFLLLPQAWTISLEILFYFFAPILVRQKSRSLLLISFFSLSLRIFSFIFLKLDHDPWEYRFLPFEIIFFIAGILLYRFYQHINFRINPLFLLPLFTFTLFYSFLPFNNRKMLLYFLVLLLSIPLLFKFTQSSKLDRLFSEISYPLYLSHFLIINILTQIIKVNHYYLGLYALLISLPVATLSYFFFQKHFDRYRIL